MQVALVVLSVLSVVGAVGTSPCLSTSLAPVTARILTQALVSNFTQFPTTVGALSSVAQLVWDSQVSGTEQQAALFFATPATGSKLLVRVRNCVDFSDAACEGQSGRIVEVYCPTVFSDESNHVFTFDGSTLTPVTTLPFEPSYEQQFWYQFGVNGNTGFLEQSSQIPELNAVGNETASDSDVYVRLAVRTVQGQSSTLAVVGAIRSANEPCNPPVNCVLGAWTAFGKCNANCGGGLQTRTRAPTIQPQGSGTPCGNLGDSKACNVHPCDDSLTGKARAGVVIACIAAVFLSGLIFFALSKNKRIFDGTKSTTHQTTKKQQPTTQASQPRRAPTKRVSTDEEETTPVKTVQVWV